MDVSKIIAAFAAGADEQLAATAELKKATPAALAVARSEVVQSANQFNETGEITIENVAAIDAHVSAIKAIDAVTAERKELASTQQARLAELAQLGTDPAGNPVMPANPSQDPDHPANPANLPGADDPEKPTEGEPTEGTEGAEGVQAGGRRKLGGRGFGILPGNTEVANVTTLALRNGNGVQEGTQLNRRGVADQFAHAFGTMGHVPGEFSRVDLVRLKTDFPASRRLGGPTSDALDNKIKIEELTNAAQYAGREALTAAGGFCSPFQVLYDIPVIGDTDRPIRDALNRVTADRGGITYRPALDGVTQTGGIGKWTTTDDTSGSPTPKSCALIACPGVVSAQVDAIYQCIKYSNMSARFDPEFADSVVQAQGIAHARFADNNLWTQIAAGSTRVQSKQLLGATRDILVTIDKVVAYYRSVHRLTAERNLRLILPQWAFYLMAADIARQMPGDGLATLVVTMEQVNSWFASRHVAVTWHLDGVDPADITSPALTVPNQVYVPVVADQVVYGFPDVISALLFAEGDWLLLDGGNLDLGIIRDSTLVGLNQYEVFSESFEHAAFRGVESLNIDMSVQPTGAAAATVSTETITTGVVSAAVPSD